MTIHIPGYPLTALAIFPHPYHESDHGFLMHEYKLKENGELQWYRKYNKKDGHYFIETHQDLNSAINTASNQNKILIHNIEHLQLSESEKLSLKLKVEKAITSLNRRINEEELMLNEAIRRNQKYQREELSSIVVPNNDQNIRLELFQILSQTPYIKLARINKYHVTLFRENNNHWIKVDHNARTAQYCYREKIARGFGYSGRVHWGKTKAAIRSILLPRANQLLQLASVKRMLDEALLKGQKVLVSGGYVFWFEEKDQVGWTIKQVKNSDSDKDNNALWLKGTILSKNHGRIVVLPYIKDNGEYVQGHTKNAPQDGKALPRHKKEYVELPFEILKDDLMIGLFGELKYE
jgi:hypothetical protein